MEDDLHVCTQLASLLFVLIRLLIATKMACDFGDATFTLKIDPVFYFEMNDKIKIGASEKEKSCKNISTTPGDLTQKYKEHDENSPDSLPDSLTC